LHSFQAAHRYGKAGTDDLREALEAESGRDLTAYFREWVEGTTLPVLRYSHRTEPRNGGFRTTVDVRPSGLPGPVPLVVTLEMDRAPETQTVTLPAEGGVFTFDTAAAPRKVALNPDRALLARIER
jgi:aminopeptidase N